VLCLFFFIGNFSDKIVPTVFLPVSFVCRGIMLIAIYFLTDPGTAISYLLWMGFALCHIMESIGVDGFYAKNVKNEIAGTMWGIMGMVSLLG
jgi:hypothetical protein